MRKCSQCGQPGHNKATCIKPKKAKSAQEIHPGKIGPTVGRFRSSKRRGYALPTKPQKRTRITRPVSIAQRLERIEKLLVQIEKNGRR